MDYSASYKIILLGEEGVGKTSLFNRIKTGKFYDGHWQSTTGGSDCYQYPTTVDNDRVMVSLWDTAGLERFRSVGSPLYTHYRRAAGALLVYSVDEPHTFEKLQEWITEATHFVKPPQVFKWALIGNKCDLSNEIESTRVEARCEQLQTKLSYTVSAKTGKNVMKAFKALIAAVHKDNEQEHNGFVHSSVRLHDGTSTVVDHEDAAIVHDKSKSCC